MSMIMRPSERVKDFVLTWRGFGTFLIVLTMVPAMYVLIKNVESIDEVEALFDDEDLRLRQIYGFEAPYKTNKYSYMKNTLYFKMTSGSIAVALTTIMLMFPTRHMYLIFMIYIPLFMMSNTEIAYQHCARYGGIASEYGTLMSLGTLCVIGAMSIVTLRFMEERAAWKKKKEEAKELNTVKTDPFARPYFDKKGKEHTAAWPMTNVTDEETF